MPERNVSAQNPYAYQTMRVLDAEMAYIDTAAARGAGDAAIVFIHGNPTSSYLWRNVVPHLQGRGRCLAPDLLGFGRSSGMPSRSYRFADHARYVEAWLAAVLPAGHITFVVQDWGAALAFDWSRRHPVRVKGICYGEAMVQPRKWVDLPDAYRERFQWFRTPEGFAEAVKQDFFVEKVLPNGVLRGLDAAAHDEYRKRYASPDGALPSVVWPREIPFDGEPADNHATVQAYADWLSASDVPKLFVNTASGHALIGRNREFCRTWPNQKEVVLDAKHYYQEDCPTELGRAIADWHDTIA